MRIFRNTAATCVVTLAACATAAPGSDSSDGVAPIVERDDLVGCVWEELGAVEERERSSISFNDEGALRRELGRAAARRGATVVVDYRSVRLSPVATGTGDAGRPRQQIREARGVAVRIEGGSCPAASPG